MTPIEKYGARIRGCRRLTVDQAFAALTTVLRTSGSNEPIRRKTVENRISLKRSTRTVLRGVFANRLAPCGDDTTKLATSSQSVLGDSSPAFTAARRQ